MIPADKKFSSLLPLILITVLGFAVYGNAINGAFLWDDQLLIKDNQYIRDYSYLGQIFSSDTEAGAGEQSGFWRPIQIFTYTIEYSLWQLNASGYHLTNIILHILVALSVFWLVNILFDNQRLALFTGLLFVAHPIHTGAVAYISGRADSLAALFMLLCFVFYSKTAPW